MKVLEGKAALVTGSARGIGRAAAALLAEHGASVMVADLDEGWAGGRRPSSAGRGGLRRRPDEDGVCEALVESTVDAFGKLDIVVNNAGYTWDGIAHRMSDEQFRAMLEIHTVVPFRILKAAAPHFRDPAKQEAAEGAGGLPQGGQRHLDRRHAGQRRPGELLGGEGRARRADEDARPRVGAVEGERQRRRLRLRRDAADRSGRGRQTFTQATSRSRSASRRQMRELRADHPARAPRDARRRPPARSSSSARRGRTSCTAR